MLEYRLPGRLVQKIVLGDRQLGGISLKFQAQNLFVWADKLVKALIYPETSEDGVYEEYYYWDERLFFAYVWTGNKKELYYYDKRGKLIRWIDTDGTVHDKENDSTEYTKRGEKYWKNALEQLDE